MTQHTITTAHEAIREGRASLGIELGSTRIKACLVDDEGRTLASGHHSWDNELADGLWTYRLEDARAGLRAAYAALAADVERAYGERIERLAAVGVSAMMHGYLAFDAEGELLVPFRTWRNVNTTRAAGILSDALGVNIPLRWSIAHLHQAVLDGEEHVGRIAHITTLAGYVHELLTGERVLGVGDASGMFPLDPETGDYDVAMLHTADELLAQAGASHLRLTDVLPPIRRAGEAAGTLTDEGAALLDATGALRGGAVAAPPEGDAGTGMVATNAVAPRTGNVSVGTSIFAMVVLERRLASRHADIDIVATPSGVPVAMVHCNNGVSELGEWAGVFHEFAGRIGSAATRDEVFEALLSGALETGTDEGILAYNHLSGEPIAGLDEGRPMIVRTPGSRLSLPGVMRAQVRGAFATLSLGMRTLADEGVRIDEIAAHGGMFRTKGVAQRLLAAALGAPVVVSDSAGEGGAWGMALLAAYAAEAHARGEATPLPEWLAARIFRENAASRVEPASEDVADHEAFLARWEAGLAAERAAAAAIR
ncbi:FGGY-family carbohydrate kinase [Microbacterium sp. Marseille-Q6965]|uniref:FGGY-family carbohydrate kinase n=1 Tax=Microbacterium sp. Marseille-Q6965 TaxID=2965072 RepID=UPI0021B71E6E|nr:FGGY-family carbohydrate kinase [Microbacterium sp. Marseille-Q6965]